MPMELYSSEAFVRDIVNAISRSEGKPLNIGGDRHHGIERDYVYQLISEAKRAIEGNAGSPAGAHAAGKGGVNRTEAIKKLMTKLDRQEAAAKKPRAGAAKRTSAARTRTVTKTPRRIATRRTAASKA